MWWHIPLILTLKRQRQVDLFEFKAILVHRVSSRSAGAIGRPCLEKEKNLGIAFINFLFFMFMNVLSACTLVHLCLAMPWWSEEGV